MIAVGRKGETTFFDDVVVLVVDELAIAIASAALATAAAATTAAKFAAVKASCDEDDEGTTPCVNAGTIIVLSATVCLGESKTFSSLTLLVPDDIVLAAMVVLVQPIIGSAFLTILQGPKRSVVSLKIKNQRPYVCMYRNI
uniref:Uncharacterized protein n=1 Tax=Glossina pallidipes TaxID=7398 RepID=A0A1A9ZLR1_GLOPL